MKTEEKAYALEAMKEGKESMQNKNGKKKKRKGKRIVPGMNERKINKGKSSCYRAEWMKMEMHKKKKKG